MKKSSLDIDKENNLEITEFGNYLKSYQEEYTSEMPVIFQIAKAKEIDEAEDSSFERIVNMTQYGNTNMNVFYFHKTISTILIDHD